jgi:hypothetical protein
MYQKSLLLGFAGMVGVALVQEVEMVNVGTSTFANIK